MCWINILVYNKGFVFFDIGDIFDDKVVYVLFNIEGKKVGFIEIFLDKVKGFFFYCYVIIC